MIKKFLALVVFMCAFIPSVATATCPNLQDTDVDGNQVTVTNMPVITFAQGGAPSLPDLVKLSIAPAVNDPACTLEILSVQPFADVTGTQVPTVKAVIGTTDIAVIDRATNSCNGGLMDRMSAYTSDCNGGLMYSTTRMSSCNGGLMDNILSVPQCNGGLMLTTGRLLRLVVTSYNSNESIHGGIGTITYKAGDVTVTKPVNLGGPYFW